MPLIYGQRKENTFKRLRDGSQRVIHSLLSLAFIWDEDALKREEDIYWNRD